MNMPNNDVKQQHQLYSGKSKWMLLLINGQKKEGWIRLDPSLALAVNRRNA